MMKPRTVASYIPLQDPIGADFIDRIRLIRDPVTNEVPNLLNEFYKWAMECKNFTAEKGFSAG